MPACRLLSNKNNFLSHCIALTRIPRNPLDTKFKRDSSFRDLLSTSSDIQLENPTFASIDSYFNVNSKTTVRSSTPFNIDNRAATIHRCIGEPRYFFQRYEYRYLNKISRYYDTIKYGGKLLVFNILYPSSTF